MRCQIVQMRLACYYGRLGCGGEWWCRLSLLRLRSLIRIPETWGAADS